MNTPIDSKPSDTAAHSAPSVSAPKNSTSSGASTPRNPAPPAAPTTSPDSPNFDWSLMWARTWYWSFTIVSKIIVTIVYLEIVSQGIVHVFPDMGKRFWKIPGFAFLNEFEATHRITIAHVFAVIPLLATWILWGLIFRLILSPERFEDTFRRYRRESSKGVVVALAVTVIVCDAGMFAASFAMSSWGEAKFSPTTVLVTGMYCAIIAFVSFYSMFLGDAITDLLQKRGS